MESNFLQLLCTDVLSKKPMATHQASINIQEPTKFKLEATRIRVEHHFHFEPNSKQTLKSEHNSKTQLYKFEKKLSKHPEFESEPTATKPQVNGSEPWQTLQLRQQILPLMMRQSAA